VQMPDFYDIYGVRTVPFWHTRAFCGAALLLFMVVAGLVVYALVRWWLYIRNTRLVPYDVRALRDLNGQEIEELLQNKESERFYSLLISILKNYLAQRYNVSLISCTDSEMLERLALVGMDGQHHTLFKGILFQSTHARFANAQLMYDQMCSDHQTAIVLVKSTAQLVQHPVKTSTSSVRS